jgi:hypothetical protein
MESLRMRRNMRANHLFYRGISWLGGRIRTSAWWNQNSPFFLQDGRAELGVSITSESPTSFKENTFYVLAIILQLYKIFFINLRN